MEHIKDINIENPLGMKGELAKSYGNLIKGLWHDSKDQIEPWNFKRFIGDF